MVSAREAREFTADEIAEAIEYIESLPPDVRIYVDEWAQNHWRFMFGDARNHARMRLARHAPRSRFRIRPAHLS